jgi:lipoprotein-anchoring transpeptidase ErfK/SrfK
MPWRHDTQLTRGKAIYWKGRTVTLATVSAVMAAALVYYLLQVLPAREMRHWPMSVGTVIEARTIVRQFYDGERGSAVQFQPEIRVIYLAAGGSYTRWFALAARGTSLAAKWMRKLRNWWGQNVRCIGGHANRLTLT